MSEPMRLSKLMAQRGICSRREADELIAKGLVKVDGVIISELGTKVSENCSIEVIGRGRQTLDDKVTILLNKPVGYVSSQPEKGYKAAVELITLENLDRNFKSPHRFHPSHRRGLAPAGRLDIDSQGLLVLTQNGVIAKQIIGEQSEVDKEYLVRIRGVVTKDKIAKLCFGLELDGEPLKHAQVEQINPDQLRMILIEGKKRQIRRMCELVDLQVIGLKRVRIGQVKLGRLAEGKWRYLGPEETF